MHPDAPKLIIGLLIAAFVIFRIYTRVRASIGRQKLRPATHVVRALILAAVCTSFLASPLMSHADFLGAAAGALVGLGLATYALGHTKVETTPEGQFYTGHPIIGLLVTGLLVVRIGFRVVQAYAAISTGGPQPSNADGFAATFSSPTTLAVFFLTTGYYVVYGAGLLMKARRSTITA